MKYEDELCFREHDDISKQFKNERPLFELKAKEWTKQYAMVLPPL